MDQTLEATLTVGPGVATQLLKDAGVDSFANRSVGPGQELSIAIAKQLFQMEANGKTIPAEKVLLHSDGLEVNLTAFYPRPAADSFRLQALFVTHLPPPGFSALIVTDENGNMLGSHIFKADRPAAEFRLHQSRVTFVASDSPGPSTSRLTTTPPIPSEPLPLAKLQPSFAEYFRMGVHHILTGPDHLLFLCGLLVVSRRLGGMLAIITCFTLAHSVTLGLAALNIVSLPAKIVEPIIAASIILVGVENFRRGDTVRARCWLAFGFGLIHGFGLADALRNAGLGSTVAAMIKGLLSFNVGVELGQLLVAAIFLSLLWQLRKLTPVERYATPALSTIIIGLGCWWLVQRTLLS